MRIWVILLCFFDHYFVTEPILTYTYTYNKLQANSQRKLAKRKLIKIINSHSHVEAAEIVEVAEKTNWGYQIN